MTEETLHYDRLVEAALKGVVRSALLIVAREGLPGNHHFYITFGTRSENVVIPPYLREKYPDEMTIVLQYQFLNLRVEDEYFSVGLSFNNVLEQLIIPFDAVTGFADPSVKFGLQFHHQIYFPDDIDENLEDLLGEDAQALPEMTEDLPVATAPKSKSAKTTKANNNVVSLDKFRNKKK
jgi:uncharacterized protein